MLENKYQSYLKKKIKSHFPDCIILKNDDIQGFPDLIILNGNKWAALEIKRQSNSTHRPNQDYWVDKLNKMSYAAFIFPENEEGVLNALERALQLKG